MLLVSSILFPLQARTMVVLRFLLHGAFTVMLWLALSALPSASPAKQFDSIYSFGDSLTDTGNLIRQGEFGQFDIIGSLPYGKSIGKATGRCSDGLLMIDFIAKHFGLPYLCPYLDRNAKFKNGVNFAVAGATALDASHIYNEDIQTPYTNSSLNVQLGWFDSHVKFMCSSDSECKKMFANSLFMLGEVGGNDYNYAFVVRKPIEEVTQLVPSVIQSITDAAKRLINHGARHLVVPGNFPIGCFPIYLTLFETSDPSAYNDRNCLINYNRFAELHNKQLQKALMHLRAEFPDVDIKYADHYGAVLKLVDNAVSGSGSENVLTACCGMGGKYNFNPTKMCDSTTSVCKDLSSHISWDGIHLTQQAYKKIVTQLVSEGIFD